jgi:hypothetical protein
MATRDGSKIIAGYRRVTREQLLAILRDIEGMPAGAVPAIGQNVWSCAPAHPQARILWARASRALEPLHTWLDVAEELPIEDDRIRALGKLLASASGSEGQGYSVLIMFAVDALRAEGLPLRSSRRAPERGALEIMADVLYWVWRRPDVRARDLRRDPSSIGAVYWKTKKNSASPSTNEVVPWSDAPKDNPGFIWIPVRVRSAKSSIS